MENKKLLKFLYKDIAEIEEMFAEKGKSGFDNFEIEFIQSRFTGAKQIIQILSEKENQFLTETGHWTKQNEEFEDEIPSPLSREELEEEEFVDEGEELIAEVTKEQPESEEEKPESCINDEVKVTVEQKDASEPLVGHVVEVIEEPAGNSENDELELDEEVEPVAGGQRLGDRILKEKSVNDLAGTGSNNLEYKISNSPVSSIQSAIGINDRYQYIRELFDGSAERFTEAITSLDNMKNIQDAVAYLQLNYKWKKTETSLKFVNLVKRRFANG